MESEQTFVLLMGRADKAGWGIGRQCTNGSGWPIDPMHMADMYFSASSSRQSLQCLASLAYHCVGHWSGLQSRALVGRNLQGKGNPVGICLEVLQYLVPDTYVLDCCKS